VVFLLVQFKRQGVLQEDIVRIVGEHASDLFQSTHGEVPAKFQAIGI
jgi:hypothetical protein